jgi:alpha-ketoglutarate-dependent taurine dioxygenase
VTPLEPFGVIAEPFGAPCELGEVSTSQMESLAASHGVVVLRGVRAAKPPEMIAYCQRMGPLLEWPFGYMLDVKVVPDTRNYLFTRDVVPFHWDGVFARADPHYLFFQCAKAPVSGGESLFCDTTRVWNKATPHEREWMKTCVCRYHQEKNAHYGGDVTTALVRQHAITGEYTIRYTEPVSGVGGNAPELLDADAKENERLARYMARALYAADVCLTYKWRTGDYVLFDNHKHLHGRRAFDDSSERHLQRIHIL